MYACALKHRAEWSGRRVKVARTRSGAEGWADPLGMRSPAEQA